MYIEKYGFESPHATEAHEFREVREEPFDLYGLMENETGGFCRMPMSVAETVNRGVASHSAETAGGRIRFATDSDTVILHAMTPRIYKDNHFPLTGSAGFDLYILCGAKYRYYGTFRPSGETEFEQVLTLPDRQMREIMIHFPLYTTVQSVYIGLQKDAALTHGRRYRYEKPVVYYGSSITQGGCASRPGNSYESIISIDTDSDFLNLGFSGNARGEATMRDYIAGLDMAAFVMDYDHNAPNVAHLAETHEPFFRAIREAHPDLPVIFVSRPNTNRYVFGYQQALEIAERRDVIHKTYINAMRAGDANVYFIDGDSLFAGPHRDLCTVDATHPNDAGFLRMADVIGAVVASVLQS